MASWIGKLDKTFICLREKWAKGQVKYQLVGDNWDNNIIPAFRTSQQKTLSLHLFIFVVEVDRIIPSITRIGNEGDRKTDAPGDKEIFIPSIEEQSILMDELVFLFATSVIQNVPQMKAEFFSIYEVHLHHWYTAQAGEKNKVSVRIIWHQLLKEIMELQLTSEIG